MSPTQRQELERLLETLPFRDRVNLLLELGMPAADVLGVPRCSDHVGYVPASPTEPLRFDGSMLWCKTGHWVKQP